MLFIPIDLVPAKMLSHFIFKSDYLMMLLLVVNICNQRIEL
jgi:hypothetical protein